MPCGRNRIFPIEPLTEYKVERTLPAVTHRISDERFWNSCWLPKSSSSCQWLSGAEAGGWCGGAQLATCDSTHLSVKAVTLMYKLKPALLLETDPNGQSKNYMFSAAGIDHNCQENHWRETSNYKFGFCFLLWIFNQWRYNIFQTTPLWSKYPVHLSKMLGRIIDEFFETPQHAYMRKKGVKMWKEGKHILNIWPIPYQQTRKMHFPIIYRQ